MISAFAASRAPSFQIALSRGGDGRHRRRSPSSSSSSSSLKVTSAVEIPKERKFFDGVSGDEAGKALGREEDVLLADGRFEVILLELEGRLVGGDE